MRSTEEVLSIGRGELEGFDKLDPTVKEKWITALRGGEYKQVCGTLRDRFNTGSGFEIGYCCLGVLCEVYRDNVGGSWEDIALFKDETGLLAGGWLSPKINKWAGLVSSQEFSTLNDNYKLTFDEIATIIEVCL